MKKIRIAALVFALCLGAAAMAGCGDEKSNKKAEKKEEKKTEQAVESVDEDELESAIEEAAEKLDKEDEETATEFTGYAPTEEILNADYNSGLIQIGNDIFRQGGFYTVKQFFEEYSDRYDFYYEYWDSRDYTEFNIEGIYSESENGSLEIVSKTDPNNSRVVFFQPLDKEAITSVGDCIVTYILRSDGENMFYPHHNDEMKYTEVEPFLESLGYKKGETYNGEDIYNYSDEVYKNTKGYWLFVKGSEKNLFGEYPFYKYRFAIDDQTGKVEVSVNDLFDIHWRGTSSWIPAEDSQ